MGEVCLNLVCVSSLLISLFILTIFREANQIFIPARSRVFRDFDSPHKPKNVQWPRFRKREIFLHY